MTFGSALITAVQDFFTQRNFELYLEKVQFRKTTSAGFQAVIFSISQYESEVLIEVIVGVQLQKIEQITAPYNITLQMYQQDSLTWLTSLGQLQGKEYFRFKVKNLQELQEKAQEIMFFFETVGFDFLDKYSSLENTEKLLNQFEHFPNPYSPSIFQQSLKGTACAWAVGHPKWKAYAEHYLAKMQLFALPETHQQRFEAFYDDLWQKTP